MSYKSFRSFFVLILVMGMVAIPAPQSAHAAGPWYVSPTGNDNNDCLGPGTPCSTINGAIGKASAGDIINTATGIYIGAGTDAVVVINKDITLSGGWNADFSTRNGTSTIDGQGTQQGIASFGIALMEFFTIQNGSAGSGGGIWNAGTLTLNNVNINNNNATGYIGNYSGGGGLYNGGTVTLNDTTLRKNSGFGITNEGSLTINNSMISDNTGYGIAVLFGSSASINNSTVSGNTNDGIFNRFSLNINNSTIKNNSGYGIQNWNGGNTTINNSTISGNQSGGIYQFSGGAIALNSSTISANIAGQGGGIYADSGIVTLQNTIIAGNSASTGADCWTPSTGLFASLGYNLIGNSLGCNFTPTAGDLIDFEARLGLLIGSPAYHPLMSDSPAVDAGNPAGCSGSNGQLSIDQRGVARDATCDIGAYEYTVSGPAVSLFLVNGSGQHTAINTNFPNPLQAAALDALGSPVSGVSIEFTAPTAGASGTFVNTGNNAVTVDTDAGGIATTSPVTANAQAGAYSVSASTPGLGMISFQLEQIAPPANDNFNNAQAITGLPFSVTVDTSLAGIETGEPQGECEYSLKTVWYSFTPAVNVAARADINFSDTSLKIFQDTGPGIGGLSILACSAYGISASFYFEAGVTYYIQAGNTVANGSEVHLNLQEVSPPANDNFSKAALIGSLPFSSMVNNTESTIETKESQLQVNCTSSQRTVWHVFTPTANGMVRADTAGSSFGDTSLNVYQATSPGIEGLSFLTCSNVPSLGIEFNVQAGATYYLQAGSIFSGGGDLYINLQEVSPPVNDGLGNAESITALPFSATVDITDASIESNEPQFCYFMGRTIWYSFIPTESMLLRASTLGSSISGNVNIYQATGDGFSNLQHLQCSGPGGSPTFQVEANQTYYLQVGPAFGEVGTVHLNLERVIPPANDNFANPETIAGIPFSTSVNITDAQIESNEPQFCYFMGRTVWYSFIPTEAMSLKADTFGSSINGNVNVYSSTGADFSNLQFMQCSGPSNSPIFQVEAGQTYYLQAGPAFGEVGTIQVNLQRVAAITGRITDSITGVPLPGDGSPFTSITLRRCDEFGCNEFVNQQQADSNGQFRFSTYYFGSPLPTGTYQIEITAALYQTSQVGSLGFVEGQDLNLGDVPLTPVPLIGSISGRLLDSVTGKPISADFQPLLQLYNCNEFGCSFMNSQTPDSAGRYRFETDFNSNRLPAGTYQVVAFADQYEQGQTNPFDVGENINRAVNLRLKSFPVRFSEIQPCVDIPAAGGECIYSVKVTNGSRGTFKGSAWSVVDSSLPDSFTGFTNFQTREPQEISIDQGKSKVLQFKFRVPANNSTFGTYICPQAFVGQGKGPLFNTVGQRGLFCVYRNAGGFTILSPEELQDTLQQSRVIQANTLLLTANGTDIEPNNMCATAQDFGEVTLPYTVEGGLDSTQSPDIDFFRFSGMPNSLVVIDLEGAPTGKGTVSDPYLGFFDSNCNVVAINDDSGTLNSRLEITIPADGIFILASTICCDGGFSGGGTGTYQLTISPVQIIGSISGRATDASTGNPLPGDTTPFTFVSLRRCEAFGCFEVNTQSAGSDGRFNFTGNFNGAPLRTGTYQIVIFADQYQTGDFGQFFVGDSEIRDLGDMPLQSYPVRFSDIQACTVSSTGGVCEFSVKVTNGMSAMLSGKTWSIVDGFNIGSFTNYTRFQTSDPQNINLLGPGKSKVLRFSFRIPAGVADGATICAQVFVGEGTNAFFNTNGHRHLFCFSKGASGFTLMSEQEAQAAFRELQTQDLVLPDLLEENKK